MCAESLLEYFVICFVLEAQSPLKYVDLLEEKSSVVRSNSFGLGILAFLRSISLTF